MKDTTAEATIKIVVAIVDANGKNDSTLSLVFLSLYVNRYFKDVEAFAEMKMIATITTRPATHDRSRCIPSPSTLSSNFVWKIKVDK